MMLAPKAKTKAIVAYITFIGTLISFFMNREEKHDFTTQHIKNMFGLLIIWFCGLMFHKYSNIRIGDILQFSGMGLWLFSIITAILGKEPAIPFLSKKFQEWFTFLD